MKIKRFFAKDMRQAIRNVREELGPDAVILSNRKLNGGIEIVSAIDYDESLFSNMSGAADKGRQESLSQEQHNQVLDSDNGSDAVDAVAANTAAPAEWMEDPMLIHMKQELKHLRGVLENQLSQFSQSDLQRRDPERAAIIHRLEQLGIDTDLSQEIATMLPAGLDTEQGGSGHRSSRQGAQRLATVPCLRLGRRAPRPCNLGQKSSRTRRRYHRPESGQRPS